MEILNRDQLEGQMRRRARLVSAAHRRALARLLGSPPDIANVPVSFWKQVHDQMEALLVDVHISVFAQSARQHGADAFDAEQAAASFAMINALRRAGQYLANTLDRLVAISRKWRDRLGLGGRITRPEIDERLENVLGTDRADGLIETEVTRASVAGGEWAARQLGLTSPEDRWKTNPLLSRTGPCPICAPLDGVTRAVWETQFPFGPPAHPRCVCEIIYVNID